MIFFIDNCIIHKSKFYKVCVPVYSPDFISVKKCFSLKTGILYDKWRQKRIRLTLKYNFTKVYDYIRLILNIFDKQKLAVKFKFFKFKNIFVIKLL